MKSAKLRTEKGLTGQSLCHNHQSRHTWRLELVQVQNSQAFHTPLVKKGDLSGMHLREKKAQIADNYILLERKFLVFVKLQSLTAN